VPEALTTRVRFQRSKGSVMWFTEDVHPSCCRRISDASRPCAAELISPALTSGL
jgi:hypothetical protein